MAINKISEFPKVTPSADDKILIEKNGEGGHINLSEMPVSTPVNTKITGEVNSLKSRIDNIMASSGDNISEIVDARQGSDGTNYASLRERLDAEHSELKGDIYDVQDEITTVVDGIAWESGTLDNGAPSNYIKRCRTADYIKIEKGIRIRLSLDADKMMIVSYDSGKTYLRSTDYITASQTVKVGDDVGYIKIVGGLLSNADLTASDRETIASHVSILSPCVKKNIKSLDERIGSVENHLLYTPEFDMEIGTLEYGFPSGNNARCRTADYIRVHTGSKIEIRPDSDKFKVVFFDGDKNYLSETGWISNEKIITVDNGVYFIKFIGGLTSNATLTVNDFDIIKSHIAILVGIDFQAVLYEVDGISNKITGDIQIFNRNIEIIAHRGLSAYAPENTKPSFALARKKGFEMVETDVQFTSDSVPVICHYNTLCCNGNNVNPYISSTTSEYPDQIKVSEKTLSEMRQMDFGAWKGAEYAGTRIMTLSEFVKYCKYVGIKPCIELKRETLVSTSSDFNSKIDSIMRIILENGMAKSATIFSFETTHLDAIKQRCDYITLALNIDAWSDSYINTIDGLRTGNNNVYISVSPSAVTSVMVDKCIENNIELCVGSVDTIAAAKSINPYASKIATNSIDIARGLYEAYI